MPKAGLISKSLLWVEISYAGAYKNKKIGNTPILVPKAGLISKSLLCVEISFAGAHKNKKNRQYAYLGAESRT